ncbi:MAG TPA: cytochrome c [Puia sp.]|jgi:mono/diheme cytochrome c family protein|nr:cytochrome c [Puia sp.]
MKRSFLALIIAGICILAVQCSSNQPPAGAADSTATDSNPVKAKSDTVVILAGINSKGIGRFKNIQLTHPLDEKMASDGQDVYQTKCFACHKLTTELLVGPGWYGVTDRRTPEWIMNWITNTKVMLDKDLAAQADMVVCLIRMPNQDLTDEQARDVLEFMRKNDGKK